MYEVAQESTRRLEATKKTTFENTETEKKRDFRPDRELNATFTWMKMNTVRVATFVCKRSTKNYDKHLSQC